MPFEIEEIKNTIKKNPVPWAIGLAVAVGAGAFMLARRGSGAGGYITEAYPEQPVLPEDIAAGPAKPGDISDAQLQELLTEIERARHEDIRELAELNRQFMERLSANLQGYTERVTQRAPVAPIVGEPEHKEQVTTVSKSSYEVTPISEPPEYHVKYFGGPEKYAQAIRSKEATGTPLADPKAAAEFKKSHPELFSSGGKEASYQEHIRYFGSPEKYAEAIKTKEKTGQTLSDPKAAAEFKKAYSQYFKD